MGVPHSRPSSKFSPINRRYPSPPPTPRDPYRYQYVGSRHYYDPVYDPYGPYAYTPPQPRHRASPPAYSSPCKCGADGVYDSSSGGRRRTVLRGGGSHDGGCKEGECECGNNCACGCKTKCGCKDRVTGTGRIGDDDFEFELGPGGCPGRKEDRGRFGANFCGNRDVHGNGGWSGRRTKLRGGADEAEPIERLERKVKGLGKRVNGLQRELRGGPAPFEGWQRGRRRGGGPGGPGGFDGEANEGMDMGGSWPGMGGMPFGRRRMRPGMGGMGGIGGRMSGLRRGGGGWDDMFADDGGMRGGGMGMDDPFGRKHRMFGRGGLGRAGGGRFGFGGRGGGDLEMEDTDGFFGGGRAGLDDLDDFGDADRPNRKGAGNGKSTAKSKSQAPTEHPSPKDEKNQQPQRESAAQPEKRTSAPPAYPFFSQPPPSRTSRRGGQGQPPPQPFLPIYDSSGQPHEPHTTGGHSPKNSPVGSQPRRASGVTPWNLGNMFGYRMMGMGMDPRQSGDPGMGPPGGYPFAPPFEPRTRGGSGSMGGRPVPGRRFGRRAGMGVKKGKRSTSDPWKEAEERDDGGDATKEKNGEDGEDDGWEDDAGGPGGYE